MKRVEIEVLKPFNRTPQGELADIADCFPWRRSALASWNGWARAAAGRQAEGRFST